MRIRVPLFVKIMTPWFVLILLSVTLSGYLIFRDNSKRLQDDLQRRLKDSAVGVADRVDQEALQAIREPNDYTRPEYAKVRTLLRQAAASGALDWLGIYFRDGDYLYYWVDTDTTGVGYPFLYTTPAHLAAFEDPQQQPHETRYADEWGSWSGFAAPIVATDESGAARVIGVVEALVSEEKDALLQQATLRTVRATLIGGVIAAIALSLLATIVTFNRPLKRLRQGAMTLASGNIGYMIPVRSNDELGDLADNFNSMSTQLKLRYDEIQQRNTELQMVYQIAQTITASSSDPDAMLNTILDRVYQMIPFEAGEICLYLPAENALRVRGWKGDGEGADWQARRYLLGTGFTGLVGQNRRSLLSSDITQHPDIEPAHREVGGTVIRSYVGVPLLVSDRLVGTISLFSTQPNRFDAHTQQLLETIALQAAVAIDTAQKVEARERQLKEQIFQLKIEVDEARKASEVAQITETEYFQKLKQLTEGRRARGPG